MSIPAPIVPDYMFHLDYCDTVQTQGLRHEALLFRFDADQLRILVVAFAVMYTDQRDKFRAMENLCLVLRRLIFSVRYKDIVFGRQTGRLSRICFRHTFTWLCICQVTVWYHLSVFDVDRVSST